MYALTSKNIVKNLSIKWPGMKIFGPKTQIIEVFLHRKYISLAINDEILGIVTKVISEEHYIL